ncbi:MAG: FecR family protein [Flammeovirgaceae bacterium]
MEKPDYSILTNYFKGKASSAEVDQVTRWSTENATEFEQLQAIWDKFGSLASTYQPDLTKAWERIDAHTAEDVKRIQLGWVARLAAILVLGIGIVWYWGFYEKDSTTLVQAETTTTGTKKLSKLLTDGSSVVLAPHASMLTREGYGQSNRTIQLKGKAFFDIAENKDLPFHIEVAQSKITVLGTSFLVNDAEEELILVVEEGTVALANDHHNTTVNAGEKAVYHKATGKLKQAANQNANFRALKTGILTFNNADIHAFAQDLENYYQIQLTIDESLAGRRITTTFDNQALHEVIQIIEATLSVKVESLGANAYLIK